ncbi:MAG: potassium channel family protein [Bacilli bacterium]
MFGFNNKKQKTDIAIIGLGSFGRNILHNFINEGVDVTIIDKNIEIINQHASICDNAYCVDSTQADALRKVGIHNFDCVIVSIGQDLNASILTTLILKEFEIDKIIVKASDENHGKILNKIGADQIVYPDKEMGKRISMQVMYSSMQELVELNEVQVMAQLIVTSSEFINKSLESLNITNNYNVMISAIRRENEVIIPAASEFLLKDDLLIVIGEIDKVDALTKVI